MLGRAILPKLNEYLEAFPAVTILGPRQVGKTTLAHQLSAGRPSVYLDLEDPTDRAKLGSDPQLFLNEKEGKLIVLDEIQRIPEIFAVLRGIIDRRKRKGLRTGQFLFLGSATHDLLRQTSESLAGRNIYVELSPFHLLETGLDAESLLWSRGGFPDSFLAPTDSASVSWRKSFIRTYVERDIPQLGPRIPAETLLRFWRMLAHTHGQLLNAQRLSSSLGVSGQTVGRYIDLLVDLMLLRRLQPWHENATKRLVRSPKLYIRDCGVLHSLLDLPNIDAVFGHPSAGASWEGFAIENLLAAANLDYQPYFYRTAAGAEIDLVLDAANGQRRYAIEVKRSASNPKPERGFFTGCEDIQATHRYVVYPGSDRYAITDGVIATPLADLMRELAANP